METKELIDKLEQYIELGHKFKTYELLKAAVRKIAYLQAENERLQAQYAALLEDSAKAGPDTCRICKHNDACADQCECDCKSCDLDCKCKDCTEGSHWEWRGEA